MRGLPEAIDHLLAVEFRPDGFRDGVVEPLWQAARRLLGEPMAWTAAVRLLQVAEAGLPVYLTTGVVSPPSLPRGETDGPLGLAAVARALSLRTSAGLVVLTEEAGLEPLRATLDAAGAGESCEVCSFPIDPQLAQAQAEALAPQIGALFVIEKIGPTPDGSLRRAGGQDVSQHLARVDLLMAELRRRKVLTIGVGDLGNEIGLGGIRRAAVAAQPLGELIATVTECDVPVVATCSNWAGFGVAAAMAGLRRDLSLLVDGRLHKAMLNACCDAGGHDSAAEAPIPAVDGIPAASNELFCDLLCGLVDFNLSRRLPAQAAETA
ncbi:MAG: DUF4392 domain-containing protein [Candidatus Dormibacteraeota bacterium]|uniref:DUF4392 domain-containing protein n=1 Tax=Candidatus Dormiibacter inghamiae TaxID=3127013 RepID=A0A934K632_9BACT|nr:DUF4392 domain-containing protein [Candidatus Dormibacteraeota bacterium]MBJ7604989.1 DUF4392 domain-containing protein [Candidatus Dormibacteraeota bacterium]